MYVDIWALPSIGAFGYSVASLGRNDIRQKVAHLRKALAPSLEVLGDIPEYDLGDPVFNPAPVDTTRDEKHKVPVSIALYHIQILRGLIPYIYFFP
jgi:hypothetical protein